MTTCAICLNTVRETRSHVPIRCGHLFHSHCIDNWKHQGKNTCPVCRKIFDGSNYKVQVIVHNMSSQTSNTLTVNENLFALEALDVFFEVQNLVDLDSLLSDFGVRMTDFDPFVFDAE
jgi:hypothetical protein